MRRAKLDGVRIGRAPMNLDRAAIVRDRIGGMTLTAVAKKWGISRSLVCKLVNRSRGGHEGSTLPTACVVDSAHPRRHEGSAVLGTRVSRLRCGHLHRRRKTRNSLVDEGDGL